MKLDLTSLKHAYESGAESPSSIIKKIYNRIENEPLNPVWISVAPREAALARARRLEGIKRDTLPLYGVPFAVKDNIDVAGMRTTAACPAFSYHAEESATVVRKLEEAGAILVGKTNMDQFATGLVGVRSPYGACASVFDERYISGGSSSGSAVAVAKGLVSFSLGTDTAGSGRVPAAFNNLVGLKPTRGILSTRGVVPACRSLDCVSVFALTCANAQQVFEAARGYDPADPYSRETASDDAPAPWLGGPFRFGVPRLDQWEFFGDQEARQLYEDSIQAAVALGGEAVEFDLQPFVDSAKLLYSGPWVAERLAALQDFTTDHADEMHPVVREIIQGAGRYSAVDAFQGQYSLEALRRQAGEVWRALDVLLLPTTGTTYTIAEVDADPFNLNSNLGHYTNFVNLLDLSAVSVPAGLRPSGLPFGVTWIGPARSEVALLQLADRLHRRLSQTLGGSTEPLASTPEVSARATPPGCKLLAVVGAHLTDQPLNHQLTSRGARLILSTRTATEYRLYSLSGTVPPKPGLIREPGFKGPGIEVEVWAMPTSQLGSFVADVPPPLGIGTIVLKDATLVKGFICEQSAVTTGSEITQYAGWRAYLSACEAGP